MKSTLMNKAQAGGAQVAQHTPGPWQYDGTRVTFQKHAYSYRFDIAGCFRDVGLEESKANARLIAAAPEMLDALKRIYRESHRACPCGDIARAAIAKAEGKL